MRASALLLIPISLTLQAQSYYSWTDENGVLHISDTPPANIELSVEVAPLPRLSADSSATASPDTPPQPAAPDTPPPAQAASTVALISPSDQATIRDSQGQIALSVALDFPLGEQQSLRLLLDGEPQPLQTESNWQLTNIDRGTHTVKVELLQNGKVIASTSQATVFLHRAHLGKTQPAPKPKPF